jgi:16S rRNA (guanine966-N2)-methyltransferase
VAGSRITGGELRGRVVRAPAGAGPGFRPTAARVREALFSILGVRVREARFADLYAGTGIVGLEALSRGAREVVFVEEQRALSRSIVEHCAQLGLREVTTVITGRLPSALRRLAGAFDVVFMDPPYGDSLAEETLAATRGHVAEGALVVYEHSSRYNPPERPAGLRLVDRRVYGDSALGLYQTSEGA